MAGVFSRIKAQVKVSHSHTLFQMSIYYQERRVVRRFVRDKGKIMCLCGPTENVSDMSTRMLDDEAYVEAGELKVVVNLLRESDSEKYAGSMHRHPALFYEVKAAVPRDAELCKFLGFKKNEKNTQLEVVAEDFWNDGSPAQGPVMPSPYLSNTPVPFSLLRRVCGRRRPCTR